MMFGVRMSSVKVGKSMKRCVVKKEEGALPGRGERRDGDVSEQRKK